MLLLIVVKVQKNSDEGELAAQPHGTLSCPTANAVSIFICIQEDPAHHHWMDSFRLAKICTFTFQVSRPQFYPRLLALVLRTSCLIMKKLLPTDEDIIL